MHRLVALLLVFSQTGYADTNVDWNTLPGLFRARWFARSPSKSAVESAGLQRALDAGWRLNPVAQSSWERDFLNGNDTRSLVSSVSQASPWGTSLEVHRRDNWDTLGAFHAELLGLNVRQDILKNGPWQGFSQNHLADASEKIALTQAGIDYEHALRDVTKSYASAVQSSRHAKAAEDALLRNSDQRKAIEKLVTDGYKAKSDLVVFQASELRSRLEADKAHLEEARRLRELELALFQNETDEPLRVNESILRPEAIEALTNTVIAAQSPSVVVEQLRAEAGDLKSSLAERAALPSVSVGANVDRAQNEYAASTKSYFVNFSVPLGATITREEVSLANIDAMSARARRDAEVARNRTVAKDFDERRKVLSRALQTAKDLEGYAKLTAQYEKQKYADGKTTIFDLRNSQEDIDNAQFGVIDAENDLLLLNLDAAAEAATLSKILGVPL